MIIASIKNIPLNFEILLTLFTVCPNVIYGAYFWHEYSPLRFASKLVGYIVLYAQYLI